MSTSQRSWHIQLARLSDIDKILGVFQDAVESTCSGDYTSSQIKVWLNAAEDTARWADKITTQYFLVAMDDDHLAGFASLENDMLDLLYVRNDVQGLGIGRRLLSGIEGEARKRNIAVLRADVSLTARRFFENVGFIMDAFQTKMIDGVEISNISMYKRLTQ
jgi:putative acetyltransferase